jgi:flagellar biosynthesis protein FlhB
MSGGEQRTEKPTPKKRRESRRDGQIARSPELSSWIGLLVFLVVVPATVNRGRDLGARQLTVGLSDVMRDPTSAQALKVLSEGLMHIGAMLVVPMVSLMIVGIVVNVAQVGFIVTTKPLKPKLDRLNPLKGLKRLFSARSAFETFKQLIRMGILGMFGWGSVVSARDWAARGRILPLPELLHEAGVRTMSLARVLGVVGLTIAVFDYAYQRYSTNKQIRMTRQEVRDEMRQQEGNQELKGKIRSKQMAMSRNRMMSMIPNADAIVVNPVHIAVAIKYDPERGAPRVIAKGEEWVAERIRAMADQHRIPIVESIPLARALYVACDIDEEIPGELYEGVARLLAFVHHLKKNGRSMLVGNGAYPRLPEPVSI